MEKGKKLVEQLGKFYSRFRKENYNMLQIYLTFLNNPWRKKRKKERLGNLRVLFFCHEKVKQKSI